MRKTEFTESVTREVRDLLRRKGKAGRYDQRRIGTRLRRFGFFIGDYFQDNSGFTLTDFEALVRSGAIKIVPDTHSSEL